MQMVVLIPKISARLYMRTYSIKPFVFQGKGNGIKLCLLEDSLTSALARRHHREHGTRCSAASCFLQSKSRWNLMHVSRREGWRKAFISRDNSDRKAKVLPFWFQSRHSLHHHPAPPPAPASARAIRSSQQPRTQHSPSILPPPSPPLARAPPPPARPPLRLSSGATMRRAPPPANQAENFWRRRNRTLGDGG